MPINSHVVWSVLRRNFTSYFINPTGYVFITVFILLGAMSAFWQEGFFLSNLANLDRLNQQYPLLLLFFIPALTMNTWSEEQRSGTDELLFTLPGNDLDIVVGKYLAALGIYTAALLFSLSHVVILMWLGEPDIGLMLSTYIGYWLSGAALLAVGMIGSQLTRNATVAFILGATFCAIFVFIHNIEMIAGSSVAGMIKSAALVPHFAAFGSGSIPLASIVYFVAITLVMLYINVALVGRRHHAGGEQAASRAIHFGIRVMSLTCLVAAITVIINRSGITVDATAERLHTLQPQTQTLIDEIPEDRPVYIQAFFSPEVPQSHVQTRKDLSNLLTRLDQVGGERIAVVIHDTEPHSKQAQSAAENYNIASRQLLTVGASQRSTVDVFLGLVFTSGPEEFVIPFFDRGLPVEYELARSIRVVSQSTRKKLGIVQTDAKLQGGFDFETMQSSPGWSIASELNKQFDIQQVPAAGPYPEDLDAILAVMPSSMTQPEMDALRTAIGSGTPTLLIDDPMPMFNIQLSPNLPKDANTNPFAARNKPPAPPKGNFDSFLSSIGLSWNSEDIAWTTYNPHPIIADVPPEVVFVCNHAQNQQAFNQNIAVTSGLQEVVMMYPGFLESSNVGSLTHTPLLQTGIVSGNTSWRSLVTQTFLGIQLNPNVRRFQTPDVYTLAMHVSGTVEPQTDAQTTTQPAPESINVIMVADADVVSETFFDLRRQGMAQFNFDNVTFALNCIDFLVGDESFVDLRKHRPQHRVLTRVEALTRTYTEQRRLEDEQAENLAADQLEQAQQRVDQKVADLRQRTDLDERTKAIMLANMEKVENRRFEVIKSNIEQEKEERLGKARTDMKMGIARIQRGIKWWAALLPPIPTLLLAIVLFAHRYKRERIGIPESRLVGGNS